MPKQCAPFSWKSVLDCLIVAITDGGEPRDAKQCNVDWEERQNA